MTSLQSISPPQVEELNDNILFTEVEWAMQEQKRNKSPGIDVMTGEHRSSYQSLGSLIKASGPEWIEAFRHVYRSR